MFSLERLRILRAISRHGSVVGAAESLHVTTSAVSQQLAKLEREAGQPLISRSGRGIRLTDAGLLLAGHADRVLSQLELAQSDLEAHRGLAVGDLRLAAFPTAARGLFPSALVTLRQNHPSLRPHLTEMEPGQSVPLLTRGDLDLAIVLDWYNRPLSLPTGLAKAPLLDDPIDIAMPADHRCAGRRQVELRDFADEDWVVWPAGEFCHEVLMFTMRSAGIEPRIAHLAQEHHTQLALVAAGLGVAVAPRLGRDQLPEGVVTIPARDEMRRHIFAVWREDADRRPSIRAAVQALEKAARDIEG